MKTRSRRRLGAIATILALGAGLLACAPSHDQIRTSVLSTSTTAGSGTTSTTAAGSTTSTTAVMPGGGTAGQGTPASCPSGSTSVSTGSIPSFQTNTNYCFAGGTYSGFNKQIPSGDKWYGQGVAIFDGNNSVNEAIYSNTEADNVTIDGFTIRNYVSGCTNAYCGGGYSVAITYGKYINITNNHFGPDYTSGYTGTGGVILGGGEPTCQYPSNITSLAIGANCYDYIEYSNISHNTFNHLLYSGPSLGGSYDSVVNYNYVTDTDAGHNINTEGDIAAIGKFAVDVMTTVEYNYMTNNVENGIWFDVFDADETVAYNSAIGTTTQESAQDGVFIEISCNAVIENNDIENAGYSDANVDGGYGGGIRISSSGSSARADAAPYYSTCGGYENNASFPGYQGILIQNNTFKNDLASISLFDGHCVVGNDCAHTPPIPDTDVTITGNNATLTTESAYNQNGYAYSGPGEGDAQLEVLSGPNSNISYSSNTYTSTKNSAFNGGSFASWKGAGYDTSGSTCSGTC